MKRYAFRALLVLAIAAFADLGCGDDDGEEQTSGTGGTGDIPGGGAGATATSGGVGGTSGGTGATGPAGTGGLSAGSGAITGGTGATGPAGAGGTPVGSGGITDGTGGEPPTAGSGGTPPDAETDGAAPEGDSGVASGVILPEVDSVEEDGPIQATSDNSGEHHVWRPTELGENGLKHPIFVWGTGFGSTPANYDDFFIRFATHGFVVVAPTPASLSANNMSDALNWILEQNDSSGSIYYQKLDTERIAMGGHSQGSMATFSVEGTVDILRTTIHIAGGSNDGRGSSQVKTPTAYICGETDFLLPQCETDFANVGDQPTFFSELQGVDHIMCARRALAGMIAWLRWHLGEETWRSAMFTGPDGEFFQGIWQSQTKNWNW